MKIFNKTIQIDDDLGSKFLPITKEVNEYFGGNLHPYFKKGLTRDLPEEDLDKEKLTPIINEDCGFNEVIVNRIISIYLELKYPAIKKKLITINDFSLGFIKSENSGTKLIGTLKNELNEKYITDEDYGCKYTLIDMEKCGFEIKFGEGEEKTVNNLSDLMIESLNYINNSNIDDTEKPTKRKDFITKVIEKCIWKL